MDTVEKVGLPSGSQKANATVAIDLDWSKFDGLCLPEWAISLTRIGQFIAWPSDSGMRLRAALTVPTSGFAAILVALGAVVLKARTLIRPSAEYLELCVGAEVVYTHDVPYRCVVTALPIDAPDGKLHLSIISPLTHLNGRHLSSGDRVELAAKRATTVEPILPNGRGSRSIPGILAIEHLIGKDRAYQYLAECSEDVIICGTKGELLAEADALVVADGKTFQTDAGSVLRPRCRYPQMYRTDFVSARGSTAEQAAAARNPSLVIFDGAMAFVNSRQRWPEANWLVVLDRTESLERNRLAIEILDRIFSQFSDIKPPRIRCGIDFRACEG